MKRATTKCARLAWEWMQRERRTFHYEEKIAMLLAAALCMGTFAGCGNSTSNNSSAADNNTTNNTAAATESSDVTASADNVKIDTLNVYFVPSRDPDEIVTATEPLANLMQTELARLRI